MVVRNHGVFRQRNAGRKRSRELHHHYNGEPIWKPRKIGVAFSIAPGQDCYRPENVVNGYRRPFLQPNCWRSERIKKEEPAWIELRWETPQQISQIDVVSNSDLDNPLETVMVHHTDTILEEILKDVDIFIQQCDGTWELITFANVDRRCAIWSYCCFSPFISDSRFSQAIVKSSTR